MITTLPNSNFRPCDSADFVEPVRSRLRSARKPVRMVAKTPTFAPWPQSELGADRPRRPSPPSPFARHVVTVHPSDGENDQTQYPFRRFPTCHQ